MDLFVVVGGLGGVVVDGEVFECCVEVEFGVVMFFVGVVKEFGNDDVLFVGDVDVWVGNVVD